LDKIIGIVLLLDELTARKAVRISRKLAGLQENPSLVLSRSKRKPALPHISMIHMVKPTGRMTELRRALTVAVEPLKGDVSGRFTGMGLRRNWVFWETPQDLSINRVHFAVLKAMRPFVSKRVTVTWPMNEAQRWMHQLYGYPSCGECFDPHVTVAVFPPDAIDEKRVREASVACFWTSPALAIAEIGPQGRATKILHRISLL